MLPTGSLAPAFSSVDQHGMPVALADLLSGGRLVLYFYPRDFTLVCTAQACSFRDSMRDFQELGANIAGVSSDDQKTHAAFAQRYALSFPLLADEDRSIAHAYEADRRFFGLSKRITYVIDKNRQILGAFQHELSASRHLEDARRLLRGDPA